MLTRHCVADVAAATRLCVRPDADALAHPDRGGSQHAPQLARCREVKPLVRPEREVLVIARQHADCVIGPVRMRASRSMTLTLVRPGRRAGLRRREPVIWIRPGSRLLRILPSRAHAGRQVGKLVAAALPDGRKRDRVPG